MRADPAAAADAWYARLLGLQSAHSSRSYVLAADYSAACGTRRHEAHAVLALVPLSTLSTLLYD